MNNLRGTVLTALCFLLFILTLTVRSQTVSVPLSHRAYDTIERWEIRNIIPAALTGSKPFTRLEMAEYVCKAIKTYQESPGRFTRTDVQELNYLQLEFQEELRKLSCRITDDHFKSRLERIFSISPFSKSGKFIYTNHRNMVSLHHEEFNFYADPILSIRSVEKYDYDFGKYQQSRFSNGLLFRGNLGNYLGFYFNLADNHVEDERFENQLVNFEVLEESGWPYLTHGSVGGYDFDENAASLTFNYKYFYFLYGREYNQWGIGHNGNLMMSTNAQLYDQIKMVFRYWRFKYTHITAFLQYISPDHRFSIKQQPHVDVYWAGNRLELDAGKGLQLGFSEAVVYGDRSLQPGYSNPLAFYKSLEHFYGDRDNGLLGVDFEWRIVPGAKIFGELLIDDITTGKLGTDFFGNKFGWQTGMYFVNPFAIPDVDLLIEYSRIKPYVYSQSFQDYNKYKHYDTILGHFIGPNSDDLFARFRKRFSKFFEIELEFEKYRHGSNFPDKNAGGDPDRPHENGDSVSASFLDGHRVEQTAYGFSLNYELLRNLFTQVHYRRFKANTSWQNYVSFAISLNFGIRKEQFRNIFPALR